MTNQTFGPAELRLAITKRGGHGGVGRDNEAVKKLAAHMCVSVHTIQSWALGRRGTTKRNWGKLATWCRNNG